MSSRQTGNRRPTKSERKDQARIEREQIHRKMASRNRNRKWGVALVAIAAVVVVLAVVLTQGGSLKLQSPKELLAGAASQEKAAGCGAVQQTPNFDNAAGADPDIDHAHIGAPGSSVTASPPLSAYATVPPASGPHNPSPAAAGVYTSPPDVYQTIHSLEHAGAIIWYAPSAAGTEAVKQIRAFYAQKSNVGQSKVIVAPYDYPSQGAQGSLPPNVQMAMVAWHRLQTCSLPNLAAAFDFSSQYSNAYPGGKYIGVAREPNSAM